MAITIKCTQNAVQQADNDDIFHLRHVFDIFLSSFPSKSIAKCEGMTKQKNIFDIMPN